MTETIRKGKGLTLSTTETAGAIDAGTIVLMNAFEARAAADEIKGKLGDLRITIHEFETREGWRALGYDSFREWALKEIDQASIRHVYRLAAAAEVESNLGVTIGHNPESHLRPLGQLEPEQQREAWGLAAELAGDGPRQAAHVAVAAQAVSDFDPLTDEELSDLSRLGGWETEAGSSPGKVRMRQDRSGDRLYTEERAPGGWRYELAQLRADEAAKAQHQATNARQQELIARAAAVGLEMTVTPKKILFYCDGAPYGGAKNLGDAEGYIKLRELSIAKRQQAGQAEQLSMIESAPLVCRACKQPLLSGTAAYSGDCTGCYHLRLANEPRHISQVAWNLKCAREYTERLPGSDFRGGRLAQIDDMIAALAAAPAPEPEPVPVVEDAHQRDVLHRHAESTLAGLLQKVDPTELRLLHCLIVGIEELYPEDDEGTAEDLWEFAGNALAELGTPDLRWIERGK